jgi:hypothetical protein
MCEKVPVICPSSQAMDLRQINATGKSFGAFEAVKDTVIPG